MNRYYGFCWQCKEEIVAFRPGFNRCENPECAERGGRGWCRFPAPIVRNCDVCGKPVSEWPDRHEYHKKDCPKYIVFENDEDGVPDYDCDCDLIAHPECCPQCNKPPASTLPAQTA